MLEFLKQRPEAGGVSASPDPCDRVTDCDEDAGATGPKGKGCREGALNGAKPRSQAPGVPRASAFPQPTCW